MRKLVPLLIALVAAGALAASALGAAGDAAHPILSRSDIGDVFDPSKVVVAAGTTVHWHNQSGDHNVRFNATGRRIGGTPGTHLPSRAPWNAQFTFNTPGTFKYYCEQHSDGTFGMVGKVVVYDPKAPPPKVTHLRAKPAKFCTNKSTTCHKHGTKVLFTLDRDAKVTGTVKPSGGGHATTVFKNKQRSKGKDSVKFAGTGLKPGKYVLRVRATGLNCKTSKAASVTVTVVADG